MDPPTPRRVRGRSVEDKADARGTRRTRRSNPSKGHAIDRSPRQLTDGIPKGKAWPRSDRPAMLLSERVTAKGNQARQYYLHMAAPPTFRAAPRRASGSVSPARTREGHPEKLRRRQRGDLDNILLKALCKE